MTLELLLTCFAAAALTHAVISVITAGADLRQERRRRAEAEASRRYWTPERVSKYLKDNL